MSPIMPKKRQCRRCNHWWDAEAAFAKNPDQRRGRGYAYTRQICIGCQQGARDSRKKRNRFADKIRNTTKRHARRLAEHLGVTATEARAQLVLWGWCPARMERDLRQAVDDGECKYCWWKLKEFVGLSGLGGIHLDIEDPDEPWIYGSNTAWVDSTCNTEKQRTPKHLFARKQQFWREYRSARRSEFFGLPLFEWLA